MSTEKKQIPVKKGVWAEPDTDGSVSLLGSKCLKCGELFFPKKDTGVCTHCQSDRFEEIRLSREGTIYSYSVVEIRPPGYYQGDVPYALGFIDLPEGIRVETLFTECDFDELTVGLPVEMVLDTLHEDDEGNEVICYKFKPIR
jgi:uncharacterized protein